MGTLSASIALAVAGQYATGLDIGGANYPLSFGPSFVFTNGSGANQASVLFTDSRTLAASASEDLDLNGVLLDAFGASVALTKVKALIILADAANTNDVVIGGATSNGFVSLFGTATDKVKVKPGGLIAAVAPDANGYAATAGTADLLHIANGGAGTAVSYKIIVIGA